MKPVGLNLETVKQKSSKKHFNMRFLGDYWENIAYKYLKKNKLKLVQRNYYSKFGEIDLVMQDEKALVFIEVKYRKNSEKVSAIESVTLSKQKKIIQTAKLFLLENNKYNNWNCRFDVLSIEGDKKNPHIQWFKNAFY
ncbi:MAG: YraN family protein [Gammaproteobacteria bacterium]